MIRPIIEICAGSPKDCIIADKYGITRVELNSALYLGGITPSAAALDIVRERCPKMEICSMVRPRGAGFCYSDTEYEQMLRETKMLLDHGSDGIVFGILKNDLTMDMERIRRITDMVHTAGKAAIIHRAFDCVKDQERAIEGLIAIGIDRVLTSGGKATAFEGIEALAHLQSTYGKDIEILPGAGVRPENAREILEKTGVRQIHSSCRRWYKDITTQNGSVYYGYDKDHPLEYDGVGEDMVKSLIEALQD